jgi:hypothetical protein
MTRILLGLAVVLLLAACANPDGVPGRAADDPTAGDASAKSAKESADKVATDVVDRLARALGAEAHLRASFVECQLSSQLRYSGNGQVIRPQGSSDEVVTAATSALTGAGLRVETGQGGDLLGSGEGLEVRVQGLASLGKTAVPTLVLTLETDCADYADEDWAQQQGFTDFSA